MIAFSPRLRQLWEISVELTSTTTWNSLLQRIALAAQSLTKTESAGVLLYEATTQDLRFVVVTTHANTLLDIPVPLDGSIAGACFIGGETLIVPDVTADPRYFVLPEAVSGLKARSLLAVPLQYKERRVGVLEVENKRVDSPFDGEDVAILTALAAYATITIENARMYASLTEDQERLEREVAARTEELAARNQRLQREIEEREAAQAVIIKQQRALAAYEERERLSRELHDGLGQVLGYINVQAQATETLLQKGENQAAQSNLQQLSRAAREAHAEVRDDILGLRAFKMTPSLDFHSALCSHIDQIQARYRLPVVLRESPALSYSSFSPGMEEQVLRIIQEALTNAAKHARATRVEVAFTMVGEQVQATITDDGVGFDVAVAARSSEGDKTLQTGVSKSRGHFGLSMMRERAERVGGQLEIQSAPGQGTRIIVTVPRFLFADDDSTESIPGMRILLADDHPLFLDGLRNLLLARGVTVVATAHDGCEALEKARALRPDVAVLDLNMPRCNGLEATRRIKAELPEIKVVLLTVSEDDAYLFEAIKSGASGYLLKSLEANAFCRLLAGLMRGEVAFAPGMAQRLMHEFSHPPAPQPVTEAAPRDDPLTPRQWEVLHLVAQGLTYKEIGAALHLSEKTIKYHMGQIVERLQLENRAQAIAYLKEREK